MALNSTFVLHAEGWFQHLYVTTYSLTRHKFRHTSCETSTSGSISSICPVVLFPENQEALPMDYHSTDVSSSCTCIFSHPRVSVPLRHTIFPAQRISGDIFGDDFIHTAQRKSPLESDSCEAQTFGLQLEKAPLHNLHCNHQPLAYSVNPPHLLSTSKKSTAPHVYIHYTYAHTKDNIWTLRGWPSGRPKT